MSVHQYFAEVEAVVQVLEGYVKKFEPEDLLPEGGTAEEEFAALWQAAELLARAYQVLVPLIQLELSKQALVLPDVQEKPSGLVGLDGNALG